MSLDSFMISLAMCLRRSASLQFHWYADSSVDVECGSRSPSIMVLLPPGRSAPPKEGPVANRVLSSMGCVQKVPLTWATPAVIMKRLSIGMIDCAQVSHVCLFSCCVGLGCTGGIGVVPHRVASCRMRRRRVCRCFGCGEDHERGASRCQWWHIDIAR